MRRRWLLAGILLVAGCDSEVRRLSEHLRTLEQQHTRLAQRLQSRRNVLYDAESRLDALNRDRSALNTEVQMFLTNHQVAAACIEAGRTSWSRGDPSQKSTVQRFGNALCGVALLSSDFAREVDSVRNKLDDADARARRLEDEIALLRRTIETSRKQVDQDQAALDQLEAKMTDLQHRLGAP